MTVPIHEAGRTLTLSEADGPKRQLLIISPGWGASGFYPAEVLRESAPTAFPAGTHLYVDHPGEMEAADRARVGRSVRDLAAVLTEAGQWRDNGPEGPGVYAVAKIMPSYETMIAELAENIGVSIRGAGEAHYGEAEGREGLIVDSLAPVESIDFVAKAGRGGKVLQLVESARATEPEPDTIISRYLIEAEARLREAANVGAWHEAHLHLAFTERADRAYADGRLSRDERIALSSAIGAALDAFRDDLETNAPHLYERDPYNNPEPATTPVDTTESPNDPAKEAGMTLEEAQARITELEGNLTAVEAERDQARTDLAEANDETARLRDGIVDRDARDHIRTVLAEADHGLRPAAIERVVESVMRGDVPLTDGQVDTGQLSEAVNAAVQREQTYLSEATGARITGLGDTTPRPADDVNVTEAETAAMAAFGITTTKES